MAYDTPLTATEQEQYNQWAATTKNAAGNPVAGDTSDYDMQGFWKSSQGKDTRDPEGNMHFPDQFKKPNHPTFSNESIYSGVDGNEGGSWGKTEDGKDIFTPGKTNLENGLDRTREYLAQSDPDVQLQEPSQADAARSVREELERRAQARVEHGKQRQAEHAGVGMEEPNLTLEGPNAAEATKHLAQIRGAASWPKDQPLPWPYIADAKMRAAGYGEDEIRDFWATFRQKASDEGYSHDDMNKFMLGVPLANNINVPNPSDADYAKLNVQDKVASQIRQFDDKYLGPHFQFAAMKLPELGLEHSAGSVIKALGWQFRDFAAVFGSGIVGGAAATAELMDGKDRTDWEYAKLAWEASGFLGLALGPAGKLLGRVQKGMKAASVARAAAGPEIMPGELHNFPRFDDFHAAATNIASKHPDGLTDVTHAITLRDLGDHFVNTGTDPLSMTKHTYNSFQNELRAGVAQIKPPSAGFTYAPGAYQRYIDGLPTVEDIARKNNPELHAQVDTLRQRIADHQAAIARGYVDARPNANRPDLLTERAMNRFKFEQDHALAIQKLDEQLRDLAPQLTKSMDAAHAEWRKTPIDFDIVRYLKSIDRGGEVRMPTSTAQAEDAAALTHPQAQKAIGAEIAKGEGAKLYDPEAPATPEKMDRLTAQVASDEAAKNKIVPPEKVEDPNPRSLLGDFSKRFNELMADETGAVSLTPRADINPETLFRYNDDIAKGAIRNLVEALSPNSLAPAAGELISAIKAKSIRETERGINNLVRFGRAMMELPSTERMKFIGAIERGFVSRPAMSVDELKAAIAKKETELESVKKRFLSDKAHRDLVADEKQADLDLETTRKDLRWAQKNQPNDAARLQALVEQKIRERGELRAKLAGEARGRGQDVKNVERDIKGLQQQIKDHDTLDRGLPTLNDYAGTTLGALAKQIRFELDHVYNNMVALGIEPGYIEDYLPHLYKNPDTAAAWIKEKSPIAGGKSFTKSRIFGSYADAMEAGLQPATENPIKMVAIALRSANNYIAAHEIVKEFRKAGHVVEVASDMTAPTDFKEIQGRLGVTGEGRLYAHKDVARLINNLTDMGWSRYPLYRIARSMGNSLIQTQLGLSLYHASFITLDAMKSQVGMAAQQFSTLKAPNMAKSVLTFTTAPFAPIKGFLRGVRMMGEYKDPGSYDALTGKMVNYFVEGGGRMELPQELRSSAQGNFLQNIRGTFQPSTGYTSLSQEIGSIFRDATPLKIGDTTVAPAFARAVFTTLSRTFDTMAAPLMNGYVPAMKAGVFSMMMEDALRMAPELGELEARHIANTINKSLDNRMGEMVYDNRFWNKAARDVAHLSVRALGWNVGDIAEIGGGLTDLAKMTYQGRQLAIGDTRMITYRASYVVGEVVTTAMLGAAIGYMTGTFSSSWGLLDYLFPPTDKDGGRKITLPTYGKDVYHFATKPGETIKGKINPFWTTIIEGLSNRDWDNGVIADPNEDILTNVGDYAKWFARQYIPISVQQLNSPSKEQKDIPWEWRALGINPAPWAIRNPDKQESRDAKDLKTAIRIRNKRRQREAEAEDYQPEGK